ncbi:S41 family peptidase [Patescibacteria group bacterium]|nr:S41 family peptidase [Patescibacteria group bacterium]
MTEPRTMPQKPKLGFAFLLILLAGIGLGVLAGRSSVQMSPGKTPLVMSGSGTVTGIGQSAPSYVSDDVEFKTFWDMWQILKANYYQQPVEDKSLYYGAMTGMAAAFGDPYTQFFEPQSAADFQEALSGKFSGIGAEIGLKEGRITIVAPLPDTPAEKAGIRAGDVIIAISGTSTEGMTVDKAVSLIRGDEGTNVTLTILRGSNGKDAFDVTITRAIIKVAAVRLKWPATGIAHIEVINFNDDTRLRFEQVVNEVVAKDPKGIILDLRNNPGGYLDIAVSMAGEWVGNSVVLKERRQGKIIDQLLGTGRNRFGDIPTIVLVNQGSASAAEIVSGALQDHKAATIIGMKTFGKGSVQDYIDLHDGSAVKVTIAEWLTPNERTINNTGLEPDIVVDRTDEDYENQRDPQLDRALGIFAGTATGTAEGTASAR